MVRPIFLLVIKIRFQKFPIVHLSWRPIRVRKVSAFWPLSVRPAWNTPRTSLLSSTCARFFRHLLWLLSSLMFCNMEKKNNLQIHVSQKVIFYDPQEKKVLLLKDNLPENECNTKYGYWELPGGHIEEGEDFE